MLTHTFFLHPKLISFPRRGGGGGSGSGVVWWGKAMFVLLKV